MAGSGGNLTAKEELLISALLVEPSMEKAAQRAGVSASTAGRWLRRATFSRRFREAKHAAVTAAITQLQSASGEAVLTLRNVCADQDASPAARVSAAKALLDFALRSVEAEMLEVRIDTLEQVIQQQQPAVRRP